MSEYIPFEIQAEILKRLPLKPLIQFRSVSKPWKCLIDSLDFILSYGVGRHRPQPDRLFLRYRNPAYDNVEDKFITFVDNDVDGSFVQQDFIYVPTLPDLVRKFNPINTTLVGSCKGLLCFNILYLPYPKGHPFRRHPGNMAILWNPLIRKYVGIQQPFFYDSTIRVYGLTGFGVCPVTFDPTVIRIVRIMNDRFSINVPWKVGVFTLSTGTWSILSFANLPRQSVKLVGSQVVIDRFIYWVAHDMMFDAEDGRSQSKFLIMSFDLTAKEFVEISLTDSLANRLSEIECISKLHESLVLLTYHGEVGEGVSLCSLWMMIDEQQGGVNRSFTKLYNINLLPDVIIYQLLGFRKTGELILVTKHNEGCKTAKVEVYNPNSECIDNLGIVGKRYTFHMCPYMETLLLVDQSDGYIYSNGNTASSVESTTIQRGNSVNDQKWMCALKALGASITNLLHHKGGT